MSFSRVFQFSKILEEKDLTNWADSIRSLLGKKTILLLVGDVGSGKTTFVGEFLKLIGAQQKSSSPSFALHNEYNFSGGTIDHVDLYRLQSEDDLESTGFWDLFGAPEGLIIIEWAQLLNYSHLPWDWKKIEIEILKDPQGRKFTVSLIEK